MKHSKLVVVALLLGGCAAATPAPASVATPPAEAPSHTACNAPSVTVQPMRELALPVLATASAEPRQAQKIVDSAGLRVATIVLRGGTVLPAHDAPVAVTIVALSGAGTLVADGQRMRLDAGHAVLLAPNVVHAVEPDAGTDMVLLVHHVGAVSTGDQHHDHH